MLGFGSLLSERSSRYTAPNLQNFRLARVRGWRRVFAHCAPIFFERGAFELQLAAVCTGLVWGKAAETLSVSRKGG